MTKNFVKIMLKRMCILFFLPFSSILLKLKKIIMMCFAFIFVQFCFCYSQKPKITQAQLLPSFTETQDGTQAALIIEESAEIKKNEPENLDIFKKAYPDLQFKSFYDSEKSDWKTEIYFPQETEPYIFYWCNGSFLPEAEFENKGKYWSLLYSYPKELKDPEKMTEEEKARLKEFSSRTNRRESLGTPMFFFEAIYKSKTRAELEENLTASSFLGKKTNIHKRIVSPLKKVEEKIFESAKTNAEVKYFIDELKSADSYNWRIIDGTSRKSFHSLGIAVDVLPKKIKGEIYWSWARDKNPNGWMLIPLSRRWLPPQKVVEIFESEGFIWGGKWGIWDNMHFEYHPELILFNNIVEKQE